MCWACWEKHTTQIEVFDPPHKCQVCNRTFEEIAAATIGEKVSMFPHWKDGVYQILCRPCDEIYVRSRRDLYGPTRFGWDRKLQ